MKFWLKFSRKFKLFSQTFELVSSNFEMQSVINLLDRLSLTRRTHKYLKNASNLLKMKNHVFIYQTNSCWIHVLYPVLRTLDFSEMLEIKHKHPSSKKMFLFRKESKYFYIFVKTQKKNTDFWDNNLKFWHMDAFFPQRWKQASIFWCVVSDNIYHQAPNMYFFHPQEMLHRIILLFVSLVFLEQVSFADFTSSQIGNMKTFKLFLLAFSGTAHIHVATRKYTIWHLSPIRT